MEERIEAKISPAEVWHAWETRMELGQKNKFRYKVLNIEKGKSFSILWKALFVRLIFSHTVRPIPKGSEICYHVQIKGLFAWPVRWILGQKIQKNLRLVLKSFARELEDKSVK